MDFNIAADLFSKVGLPVGILMFVAWGAVKGAKWLGVEVLKPMADSHVSLVKSTETINETNSKTLASMGLLLEKCEDRDAQSHNLIVATHALLQNIVEKK